METTRQMIVFDMDGVLVDVTGSYRETIVQTVKSFSGKTIERAAIQDYKNQGGWNNDWLLSQHILAELRTEIVRRHPGRVVPRGVKRKMTNYPLRPRRRARTRRATYRLRILTRRRPKRAK